MLRIQLLRGFLEQRRQTMRQIPNSLMSAGTKACELPERIPVLAANPREFIVRPYLHRQLRLWSIELGKCTGDIKWCEPCTSAVEEHGVVLRVSVCAPIRALNASAVKNVAVFRWVGRLGCKKREDVSRARPAHVPRRTLRNENDEHGLGARDRQHRQVQDRRSGRHLAPPPPSIEA